MSNQKLKARDIIPGWPRGRSIGGLGAAPRDDGRLWFPWWRLTDDPRRAEEAAAEENYHREQQEMVDRYRQVQSWRAGQYWPMPPFEFYVSLALRAILEQL